MSDPGDNFGEFMDGLWRTKLAPRIEIITDGGTPMYVTHDNPPEGSRPIKGQVPTLRAEVDRLRAEVARLEGERDDSRAKVGHEVVAALDAIDTAKAQLDAARAARGPGNNGLAALIEAEVNLENAKWARDWLADLVSLVRAPAVTPGAGGEGEKS